jgi:hypothetical protein
LLVLLASVLVLLMLTPLFADERTEVVSPEQNYLGLSYGDWVALWWQWAFSIPDGTGHPFSVGGNVLQKQAGRVWFLAGAFHPSNVRDVRKILIPRGTALFFPVGNGDCSTLEPDPFHGDDAPSLSACTNRNFDNLGLAEGAICEIDGKRVKHLDQFRTQSPMFPIGPLPNPPIFGLTAGDSGQAVDAGIYILLKPLSPGPHTIRFASYGGQLDTTYVVTVQD